MIMFDLPYDAKAFLHCAGRTGRLGAQGTVVAMVDSNCPREAKVAETVRKRLAQPETTEAERTARAAARQERRVREKKKNEQPEKNESKEAAVLVADKR